MEEGTLAKWLVKEGDDVKSGDILAEIETDKATMEFEAVDEGKIAKILVPEGTDGVKVGAADRAACRRMARRSAALPRARPQRSRGGGRARSLLPRCRTDASRLPAAAPRSRTRRRRRRTCSRRRRATSSPTSPRPTTIPKCPKARRWSRMTVREALRDAMAEEMRARRARVRDGRGGRRISGRLQGHAGPAPGVRGQARRRHADHRIWLCRPRHRRGDGRASGRSSSS